MVLSAPNWRMVCQRLANALNGKHVVIYNADYDVRLLYQSTSAAGLRMDWRQVARFWCAMLPFSEIYGDWNDYHQSYTWQKLETAARYYGIEVADAHSALGDCLMTLAVVQAMAQHERGG
jgi:DNA polymerase-3 subunit epsilon